MRNNYKKILACLLSVTLYLCASGLVYAAEAPVKIDPQSTAADAAPPIPPAVTPPSAPPDPPADPPKVPIITSHLVVTEYKVTANAGGTLSRIRKGNRVNIELTFKNSGIKTSAVGSAANIDASKLVDGFGGQGNPAVTITSTGNDPLLMQIKFSDLVYNGNGEAMRFMVGYKNLDIPYDTGEISVAECKEDPSSSSSKPQKETTAATSPLLLITMDPLAHPLEPLEEVTLHVLIKNISSSELEDVIVSLSPPESIAVVDGKTSFALRGIDARKTATIKVQVKGGKEFTAASLSMGVEVKFNYHSGDSMVQSTGADKILIPVKASDKKSESQNAIPYIIVSGFSYGGAPVAANSTFKLSMDLVNTSSLLQIENIIMTIETGENFSIASATNTFHYQELAPAGTLHQEVELQALPGAKTGAQTIEVAFKYEYIDGEKRASSSMNEKLSIPIFLPDRFELGAPKLPDEVTAGTEATVSVSYLNKGKVAVSNMEAAIMGDVPSPLKVQTLGNIESGKSGTISFLVVPEKAGPLSFLVRISYEDANGKLIVKELPIALTVGELPVMDPDAMDGAPQKTSGTGLPLIPIAGGVFVCAAVAVWFKLRHAKKSGQAAPDAFSWDDSLSAGTFLEDAATEKDVLAGCGSDGEECGHGDKRSD